MAQTDVKDRGRARERTGRSARGIAVAAGAFFLLAGIAAFVSPAAFFEAAATFEPYNEHFIRDLGAFQIGLGAVLLLASRIDDALVASLGGVGVGSLFHAVGHVLDRDLGGTPALDITVHGVLSIVLIAAATTRWRSVRRAA